MIIGPCILSTFREKAGWKIRGLNFSEVKSEFLKTRGNSRGSNFLAKKKIKRKEGKKWRREHKLGREDRSLFVPQLLINHTPSFPTHSLSEKCAQEGKLSAVSRTKYIKNGSKVDRERQGKLNLAPTSTSPVEAGRREKECGRWIFNGRRIHSPSIFFPGKGHSYTLARKLEPRVVGMSKSSAFYGLIDSLAIGMVFARRGLKIRSPFS